MKFTIVKCSDRIKQRAAHQEKKKNIIKYYTQFFASQKVRRYSIYVLYYLMYIDKPNELTWILEQTEKTVRKR